MKHYIIAPLLVLLFTITGQVLKAQTLNKDLYIAANIPDSLKEDANSVVRYSMEDVVVKSVGRVLYRHHSIVTILNEKGDSEAQLVLGYDKKFTSVNGVEMIIYNAAGSQLKKYRKSDMYDHAAVDGISIVTDDRVLSLRHSIASYPSTVEIIYEVSRDSYLDLGRWTYREAEQSVQHAEYRVTIAPSLGFRYKNTNTSIRPLKLMVNDMDQYTWKAYNLKAEKPEEDSMPWQTSPTITFAANAFAFAGITGNFSSWENYGKWQQGINADVCTLSPQRAADIQRMTADLRTDKEKAKFLYEYLQQNMRYVSIQLGIGGLKPFPASFVDDKKYGDCKALSNYMYALLKAVNIPSYYAMINAGTNEEPADAAFPSDPFNHVILCIPFKGDTTWLECTSKTQPFGKLGAFTENRMALLITETGGKLVNTPKSTGGDNQFNSEVHVILDADGGAKAKVKILSTGEYRSDFIGMASAKTDDQKEYLIRVMNIKQPIAFAYTMPTDKDGIKELDLELEYDKFCDISAGNKQFYRPRVFDLWRATVPVADKRKADFFFAHPMQKSCVTTIDLPAGFEVETLPTNQALKFTYGSYEVNYAYDAAKNQVTSTAKFNLKNHIIPAAKYTELQVYMDNIAKAQNKKLVIRRKA